MTLDRAQSWTNQHSLFVCCYICVHLIVFVFVVQYKNLWTCISMYYVCTVKGPALANQDKVAGNHSSLPIHKSMPNCCPIARSEN